MSRRVGHYYTKCYDIFARFNLSMKNGNHTAWLDFFFQSNPIRINNNNNNEIIGINIKKVSCSLVAVFLC